MNGSGSFGGTKIYYWIRPYQLVIKALGLFIKIINKKYTLPMKHRNMLNINEKECRDEMKETAN
jgi:hypothetical protein